jgi:hypothetical protein
MKTYSRVDHLLSNTTNRYRYGSLFVLYTVQFAAHNWHRWYQYEYVEGAGNSFYSLAVILTTGLD